ncbi:MAG: aldo/keto reductase [Xanthobacteraceae bacterium]|nr:aldo/keto reductase [Xanthobacteraceae bacterium]
MCLGTGTFGGKGPLFSEWGSTDVADARRLVGICVEAGANMFDSADVYSDGAAEQILGEAIRGRPRSDLILSTKLSLRMGDGPNQVGSSRGYLVSALEASLRRLGTDYVDLLQLHAFDAMTPVEDVLLTLAELVRAGKVRYVGVSNFSGWHLMKSLAAAERYGYPRYVANQTYYSLVGRDYEWELMPLGLDQGVGAIVWSPLGWGRLTGKFGRDRPIPGLSRLHKTAPAGPPVDNELLFRVLDALEAVSHETGRSVPQIALNWLLGRPTVSSLIIGARNEVQLRENLGATGWALTGDQTERLNTASRTVRPYPYWHQETFVERNPGAAV